MRSEGRSGRIDRRGFNAVAADGSRARDCVPLKARITLLNPVIFVSSFE